jgi:tetratricopeptide (TPR) repeat protein
VIVGCAARARQRQRWRARGLRAIGLCAVALSFAACSNENVKRQHFENGVRLLEAKRYQEAVVELRNAVAADEAWGEARLRLADAYAESGQPELAYKTYVRAADLLPENPTAQVKAASYLLIARQFEDAAGRARRAIGLEPGNVDAHIVLANALAGLQDLNGALEELRAAIAADPARSQPYTALARLHVVQGSNAEALAAYAEALRLEPNSVAAHLAYANFLWTSGQQDKAEETFRKAYELDPKHLVTNRVLAAFYLASGRPQDAERHLRTVAESSQSATDRFALADFFINERRFADARELLTTMAGESATRAAAETQLARLEDAEGNVAAASQRLQRVLDRDPNYTPALMVQAERARRAGQWEEARAAASAAINSNPRLVTAYYVRGDAEMHTGRLAEAMKSFMEILSLDAKAVGAMVALSRLQLSRNLVDSAILYAEEAVSTAPGDADAHLALIRAWVARGDDARAASHLAGLLKSPTPPVEAIVLDASLRLKQGDTAGARQGFERALDADPLATEALAALTALEMRARNVAAARSRVEAARRADPNNLTVMTLAAKVALASGDRATADTLLRECVGRDTLQIACFALLAQLYQSQNRLAALIEEFDARAQKERSNVAARLVAAVAVHTTGDIKDAERRYEEILKLESRTALAANNLAAIYVEQGVNLGYAEQLATTAVEQLPSSGDLADTLGSIYVKLSRQSLAIKYFQQAVALEPGNPEFHYHLGLAYAASNETERARTAFRTAVRLNAKFTRAQEALSSLDR